MKFIMKEVIGIEPKAARLGAGTGASNNLSDVDEGKFVKLVGESRYNLCAVGDLIEGFINSVEPATADGYSIGGVVDKGYKEVTFDGLQATPGTGVVAIGDCVVCGTPVAKGTALTAPAKVCKATVQPGVTVPADLTAAAAQIKASMYAWRVVSLGSAGTGAVGTTGLIERVCV